MGRSAASACPPTSATINAAKTNFISAPSLPGSLSKSIAFIAAKLLQPGNNRNQLVIRRNTFPQTRGALFRPTRRPATPTGRRWPTSIARMNRGGGRRRSSSPGRGICLCNAELRTALLKTLLGISHGEAGRLRLRAAAEGLLEPGRERNCGGRALQAELNGVPASQSLGHATLERQRWPINPRSAQRRIVFSRKAQFEPGSRRNGHTG